MKTKVNREVILNRTGVPGITALAAIQADILAVEPKRIVAAATIQLIRATATIEGVVARTTVQLIDPAATK